MLDRPALVVPFTKMNGAGNDFLVLDNRFLRFTVGELETLARTFCPRRTGIGADGLLALDDRLDHVLRVRAVVAALVREELGAPAAAGLRHARRGRRVFFARRPWSAPAAP